MSNEWNEMNQVERWLREYISDIEEIMRTELDILRANQHNHYSTQNVNDVDTHTTYYAAFRPDSTIVKHKPNSKYPYIVADSSEHEAWASAGDDYCIKNEEQLMKTFPGGGWPDVLLSVKWAREEGYTVRQVRVLCSMNYDDRRPDDDTGDK